MSKSVENEPWYALYQKAKQQFETLAPMHIWDRLISIEAPNMVYFICKVDAGESRPRWCIVDQFRHGGHFRRHYSTRKAAREALAKSGCVEAPVEFFGGKW
jgi:hypothetical protein